MDSDGAVAFLNEYLKRLDSADWAWVMPCQQRAAGIIGKLAPGLIWTHLGGGFGQAHIRKTQKEAVRTALYNLETNPALIEKMTSESNPIGPWTTTAQRLAELATTMPLSNWIAQASEAQQLVRYVNTPAAKQIGDLLTHSNFQGSREPSQYRDEVVAIIYGAAQAAKLHGALDVAAAPRTVVNVALRK